MSSFSASNNNNDKSVDYVICVGPISSFKFLLYKKKADVQKVLVLMFKQKKCRVAVKKDKRMEKSSTRFRCQDVTMERVCSVQR